MKIERIIGAGGFRTERCNNAACPAAVVTADGDVFVQGYLPKPTEMAALPTPGGEGLVKMSRATFESIGRHFNA